MFPPTPSSCPSPIYPLNPPPKHVVVMFAWFCRIYLELLHDYQLAEEYCDGLYEEGRHADRNGMQHLPASLQARLQEVRGPGGGAPGGSGGGIYLLLIQVTIQLMCDGLLFAGQTQISKFVYTAAQNSLPSY